MSEDVRAFYTTQNEWIKALQEADRIRKQALKAQYEHTLMVREQRQRQRELRRKERQLRHQKGAQRKSSGSNNQKKEKEQTAAVGAGGALSDSVQRLRDAAGHEAVAGGTQPSLTTDSVSIAIGSDEAQRKADAKEEDAHTEDEASADEKDEHDTEEDAPIEPMDPELESAMGLKSYQTGAEEPPNEVWGG
jgi:hypothetical protein